MIREILKIRTDKGLGDKDPAFKDIEISEYSYKGSRMGMPELTATLMWGTCLDEEWTRKEYVMLNGERFYIRHTPSSSKSNTDSRYKHEINFTSEFAEILGNTYFVDAVPDEKSGIICQTKNKPCSNNTTFTFYGTISEFVDRLNCAFLYAGIGDSILKKKTSVTTNDAVSGDGYVAMLDPEGDYDREKSYEFSFEDNKLWEVLTEGYNITEIPFERRGRRIVFGAVPKVVSHKFEYGYDNELLSVNKNNANAQVINRISMLGSDENIPYYYPNETEYGHISVVAAPDNKVLGASNVVVNRRNTMLSDIREGSYIRLRKSSNAQAAVNVDNSKFYTGFFPLTNLEHTYPGDVKTYSYKQQPNNESTWYVRASFTLTKASIVKFTGLQGCIWSTNTGSAAIKNLIPSVTVARLNKSGESASLIDSCSRNADGTYDIGTLSAGSYEITFAIGFRRYYPEDMFFIVKSVNMRAEQKDGYYWEADGKKFDSLAKLGLSLNIGLSDTMVGDGFGWEASGRMPFQDHLMPSIYRSTLGAERFYNALNNTYTDPATGEPYVFPNPFIEGSPSEYIYRNEEIKPTIEGITNADGKLFGEIVAIAYDSDDNDSLKSDATEENDKNDTLKYEHSFFYLKLNVFNGEYGFDLFNHATQTDPMTLQMVSGNCNGCKFKIQVVEKTINGMQVWKNPVQTTGANGNIVEGSYGDKVKESWQEWQQNTQTHSIWICVQKDAETFGVIMPNQSHNFKPAIGDKFNIINIDLPQPYIDFAEKRLEEDGIRFMAENNEEKFTFDISASRIFFAENPDVLAQLDEYSKINVIYNGKVYEQYVNQFSIDCKDSEALPNIGIGLTDTLAVGQSFIDEVAEKASSLLRNPSGANGGVRGMTMAEADQRYLNKAQEDRTPFKLSSDIGFEVGEYVSGASGGIFFRDPDTGQTYIEADKLKIRMKAIFEELEIAKVSTIGGKFIITPGGGINISFVEELANSYRCYFKAKDEDKGAECRFVVGDQVQCHEFNIQAGTYQNASNRYYWRLVTAVNNDESYIELSKTDCDNALLKSDAPAIGDTIVQLGNRTDNTRQSAIILSTVDAFAPCVTLYNGIDRYSLDGKAVVEYGVDKTKNPPRPFFHCYGDMYIGAKDGSRFLQYTPEGGLIVRGSISSVSTIVDEYGNEIQIDKYVEESAQSAADQAKAELQGKIDELQNQIDGVVETWSGDVDPTKGNYPASDWKNEYDKQAHIGDVYFNIGAYDSNKNPNAGHAWRWYYNSASDFGWIEIADSDAVRALQLAQMSVTDTDVLYIQTDSRTESPKLPTVNVTTGAITNLNGWSTDAPEWKDSKYIWQCTYVKKGDGTATFAGPTCISGKDGVNGTDITISSQSVRYSTSHTATQPADSTFTLPSVPTLSAGQYLWSMTTVTYSNGQSTKSYAVSRIGTNGTNGTNGTSVTITSTSVRYAKSNVATQPADTAFTYTSIASAGLKLGEYLWTKTEVAYSDGSSTKSYSVSRIGSDGEDGLPGAPGEDGRTPYVHYAYANSADGKTGFSTTYFKDALYVGVCSDYTQADPTDYTKYEWSRLRGEDGRGIVSIVEEYAVNNSATTAPADSAFKTDMPTMTDTNRYLWNREKTTYTDNTSETTTAVVIGVRGQNGADGATVVSVTNYYLASAKASGVKNTDAGWQTDASHANATTDATKPYLWNYEVTKWSKGADTKTDPHVVGKFGKDGRTPKITEQYYLSTSSTQLSEGSWQDKKPTWVAGRYYWTRSKIDYGDGDVEYTEGICVTPENGTSVLAEYSADGTIWHPSYQSGDVWMHTGTDGKNWSPAIRIVGANYTPNLLLGTKDGFLSPGNYVSTNAWAQCKLVYFEEGTVLNVGDKIAVSVESIEQIKGSATAYTIGLYTEGFKTQIGTFTEITKDNLQCVLTVNKATPQGEIPCLLLYPAVNGQLVGCQAQYGRVMAVKGEIPMDWSPASSEMVGEDGAWRKFQWALHTSSTSAPTNGWQDAPMTANAGEYVWMRSGMVTPPATNPTTWENATRITGDKGEKGDPGSPTYMLDLTDEVKGILCDAGGNPISSSIPTSQASVFKGSVKMAHSAVTYSIAQATGITATVNNSTGVVSLSNLTADNATVVVQAVADGVTLQSNISVYKVIPGGSYAPNLILGTKDVLFSQNSTSAINKSMKFNTVRNLKDYPAGTKLTLSFDYQYSSVSTATNFNTKRFGFQQPIKTVGTATSYIEGWMELPVNSTNISGEGTFKAIMTLPDGANVNVNEANFYIQLSKGNITLKNFKIEEGATDNPHWSPAASEMVGEDAVVYQLEPSVDSITKSMTGELSEKSVTCSVYKTTGNSTRVLTSEKTLTCYRVKTDGTTQTTILGHANGTSAGQSVTDDTEALIFKLTDDTTVLDRERVPVLSDASDLEIGGRNLLLRSGQGITTSSYLMKSFYLAVTPKVGDTYTLTLWGNLASTKTGFHIFNSGGMVKLTELKKISDGIYQSTFKWVKVSGSSTASDKFINIYAGSSSQSGTSTIERIKLEKGNKGSDWSPAPEDTGSGVNLLRNSRARYTRTDTTAGDHYATFPNQKTVHMEEGQTYTISGRTNCAKFTSVHGSPFENKCVLWICSASSSPQGTVNQIVSGEDMMIDGSRGKTFVWNHPTGDYYLRVNFYAAGTFWIEKVKIEKGTYATEWTPSPDDVEYLEDALKETTKIDGGLILTSAISLGQNNTDYTSQTTWSGISGIYNSNGTGGGIALWFGGDMLDKADYYNWDNANGSWVSKGGAIPSRIAKGVDRMDGSGYRADGNLWWDKDGNVTFVGNMVAKGEFAGIRKNSKTIITSANWKEYLKEDDGMYFINFKSLGCYAEFQYKPSGNVVFYMPEHKGYVGETVVFVNKSGGAIGISGPLITQANFDAGLSANTNSYSVPNGSTIELRCRICVNSSTKQTRTVWIQQIGTNSNDYEYNF